MVKPKFIKKISRMFDSLSSPGIKFFSNYGVTANHISLLQIPFVILFFIGLSYRLTNLALIGLIISLYLDLLDGAWARVTNTVSKKGHRYDKVLDLIGIYAFLVGSAIGFPELFMINLVLGLITASLYFLNEYTKPELYSGVRSFGCLGLLIGSLNLLLLASLILGLLMLLFKTVRLVIDHVKS